MSLTLADEQLKICDYVAGFHDIECGDQKLLTLITKVVDATLGRGSIFKSLPDCRIELTSLH